VPSFAHKTEPGRHINCNFSKENKTAKGDIMNTSTNFRVEIILAGPSFHSIRSLFGNIFLHLIFDSKDTSKNVVYNFDAELPYHQYDLRQLFTGAYPLELHRQTWNEFYETERGLRRRTLSHFEVPMTIETKQNLVESLVKFPKIQGLPERYTALSANCSTMALQLLNVVGVKQRGKAPFIPMLLPLFLRWENIAVPSKRLLAA
jgi:hypothetical protein